ncbi:hypothetical protein M758_11G055700 [Ceratodon purpureus]|nr:hypothetical protein M758_11G055700 [Ceratodon purpureus]
MARLSRGQRTGAGTVALMVLALLSLVLMTMLVLGLVAVPSVSRTATEDGAVVELKLPSHRHGDEIPNPLAPWVEVLSWEPRAFLYHHFLTQEECNHLIDLARPNLVKSSVVDSETGKSKDSRVRTSSGTFLMRGQDDVIKRIEKRIADFTFIPVEQGEGLQVLQYKESEKYDAHYDYFHDAYNTKNGGQRIATVLMYLSNVEQGGETVFPASKVNKSEVPDWDNLSECAQRGKSVRPRMGDALLFWSMKPDASLDPTSLHGGCPVINGTKWSATKWLHVGNYLAR